MSHIPPNHVPQIAVPKRSAITSAITAWTALALLALAVLLTPAPAAAAPSDATSDLLLPYFEVDLAAPGVTTLVAVVNTSDEQVPVVFKLFTNWGNQVLEVPLVLEPRAVQSVNLRDWLAGTRLPAGIVLAQDELDHLQAALCGEVSPRDGQFYGGYPSSASLPPSSSAPRRAVGYLTVRAQRRSQDVLVGDYFIVDPQGNYSQGDALVNIDLTASCGTGLCRRHGLRFLNGGAFDGGTELLIWTPRHNSPSADASQAATVPVHVTSRAFSESGGAVAEQEMDVQPLELIRVADMGLGEAFGWLDLELPMNSFVAVRYTADDRFSSVFRSACLELLPPPGPGLRLEKLTNGIDADQAPGVSLAVGDEVIWEYLVTNTGQVALSDVEVSDDDPSLTVSCPGSDLAVGASMTCTATGTAGQCGYRNVGTASGVVPDGQAIRATDASHYFATLPSALTMELHLNGERAPAPGHALTPGDPLTWEYRVTNSGQAELTGVAVTDTAGAPVVCPSTVLAAGESMTCTTFGVAAAGGGHAVGTARGESACGAPVTAADEAWYQCGQCVEEAPAIALEKATNGHDADTAPGPEIAPGDPVTWSYVVTNLGGTPLSGLAVSDDDPSLTVVCPADSLEPGAAMTCTAVGTAVEGDYTNLGEVSAVSRCGVPVNAGDRSHYHNSPPSEPPTGDQGCTPGYWKNHADSWPATGHSTAASVQSVFPSAAAYPGIGDASLIEALAFQGGSGVEGGARNLLRAAVAGLLDASHPGIDYPRLPAGLIADVDAALASGDRDTMLGLAASIDADNNLGCPLN